MRAYDCQCGEYLQAENDQRLEQQMRQHYDKAHPDQQVTDTKMRQMIEDGAYDVRSEEAAGSF
jgi:hypothetical protein